MSGPQPNAWHTGRPRQSQSASRTPQNRSSTASPSQSTKPSQPHRQSQQAAQPPANNVWAQGSSQSRERQHPASSNSSRPEEVTAKGPQEDQHISLNGFNSADVKSAFRRQAQGAPSAYKPAEAAAVGGRGSGSVWAKPNHMANNQPFFVQLAKQVAMVEGGG